MNGWILGLGTAVPPNQLSQEQALQAMDEYFCFNAEQGAHVKKLYENSGIQKRHTVLKQLAGKNQLFSIGEKVPGMTARNAIYKTEAVKLAHQASLEALEAWGGDVHSITHVISVSCTGVVIPGIEFSLIDLLGLPRSVCRLGINFMGCFGAFKGLEVANAFARENSKSRVLVVCTELCSLQMQPDLHPDSLVANSIFADGAAAVVVGSQPKEGEKPLWEMYKHVSWGMENTTEQMSWEAKDHGFAMRLSTYVPISISRKIRFFSEQLVSPLSSLSACDWAIHPGGKAVLQTVEKKLSLSKEQTKASWNTLEQFGNMSSSTLLFVLQELLKGKRSEWTAGVGFGPGLSIEGFLFRC